MEPKEFVKLICEELNIKKGAIIFCVNKYEKTLDKSFEEDYSPTTILMGALYLYCRENNIPKTLDEISNASLTRKKFLARAYRDIKN